MFLKRKFAFPASIWQCITLICDIHTSAFIKNKYIDLNLIAPGVIEISFGCCKKSCMNHNSRDYDGTHLSFYKKQIYRLNLIAPGVRNFLWLLKEVVHES
jgi:hypothetical protein